MTFDLNGNMSEKYKDLVKEYPIWEKTALTRNKGHVYGVQTFAKKIGRDFSDHDADKFGEFYIPYIFISMGHNPDFKDDIEAKKKADPDMNLFMRRALFSHITTNKHHPEAWDINTAMVLDKDGEDKQIIDATKMSDESILEMCCDWASVGAEKGNSPQSWFKLKKYKWKLSDGQEKLINDTLAELWPGGDKETAEIKHEERYFNDSLWAQLNNMWDKYKAEKSSKQDAMLEQLNKIYEKYKGADMSALREDVKAIATDKKLFEDYKEALREDYNFGEFENTIRLFAKEKESVSNIVGKLTEKNYEPTVSLQGVGSLQSLSFLFSPAITNYVMNLLDSLLNKNFSNMADDKTLKAMNLDKVELGNNYGTKSKITSNFVNGIMRSLDNVNNSKLKNKLLLVSKFIGDLKRHSKTINDRWQRQEYMEDITSFIKVINVIKNIITNRNSFINVLNKTLLLQESGEEVVSEMFVNIYAGIR